MKKLKIAVVIPPHVATQSFINLAKMYLHISKKHDCDITIFADKKLDIKFNGLKVKKISGLDSRFGLHKMLFFLGLPRFYYPKLVEEMRGFDVIESSTPELYIYALQSYNAAKKYKSRLILRTSQTIHNFFLFPFTKFIAVYFAKKACNYASRLCFTNPASRDAYIKLGLMPKSSGKSVILGHAVDTKIFRPMKIKKAGSKIVLLSVGALYKLKGHQNVINALRILLDKGCKNLELWIVGKGGYKRKLEQLAKKLVLGKHVKFLGPLDHKELAKIYNKADIFVLGNIHDATPAVSEAMLCNLPVVAGRCGGIDFVIPSEDYGIVAKWNDPKDLANGINRALKDGKIRDKLTKNARKFILRNFSIERVAERLYSAYTK